jgi:hypothetical protein
MLAWVALPAVMTLLVGTAAGSPAGSGDAAERIIGREGAGRERGARPAADRIVAGRVMSARARWGAGGVIVTEATVRTAVGDAVVVQLGGVIDGIGMAWSHQPAVLRPDDEVMLDLAAPAGSPIDVQAQGPRPAESARVTPARALYGIQHTKTTRRPLWRDSGCIDMWYDTTTVSDAVGRALDDAFATWAAATTRCGELLVTSRSRPGVVNARDGISTVHVRKDRWCRPATATEPELCYPPEAAAVTRLTYVDSRGEADDGKILEADMELNAVNFELLSPGAPPPVTAKRVLDLASVVTHEAGHVLGLAHDCASGTDFPVDEVGQPVPSCEAAAPGSSLALATMYYQIQPGEIGARTPEASDVLGACTQLRGRTCELFLAGGCSGTEQRPPAWPAVCLVVCLGLARWPKR